MKKKILSLALVLAVTVLMSASAFADLAINTTFTGIDAPTINGMKIYASGLHIIVLSPVDTTLQLTTAAGITTKLTVNAGKNVYDVAEPGIYIVGKTKVAVY